MGNLSSEINTEYKESATFQQRRFIFALASIYIASLTRVESPTFSNNCLAFFAYWRLSILLYDIAYVSEMAPYSRPLLTSFSISAMGKAVVNVTIAFW